MYHVRTSVLIAGGGPVGLCTALFLARQGIQPTLVERRQGTSELPRAPGLQARTMEIFRWAGIEPAIRDIEIPDSAKYFEGGILKVPTLSRIAEAEAIETPRLDGPEISPVRVVGCGQDRYEPILLDAATAAGAHVRFGHRLVDLEQDEDGVTALVEHAGRTLRIRADYLVAADGSRSLVRTKLKVGRSGEGILFKAMSIYFRADLDRVLDGRKFILCYATEHQPPLALSRLHGRDPWLCAALYRPEDGQGAADFTTEHCVHLIRKAAGCPDLDVEIVATSPWEAAHRIAEDFLIGRVLLAGDAAHVHPPAGGFGANTGIHDAHNLAWKIAAVLRGWAGPALLSSYDAERRPLGAAMAAQAVLRNRLRNGTSSDADRALMKEDLIVTLGYRYASAAVLGADDAPPLPDRFELTGAPGTRVPHVWVRHDGRTISTLDLVHDGFVLFTGTAGEPWLAAAGRCAVPVHAYRIGDDGDLTCTAGAWAAASGLGEGGALLVRPDGFVAWRAEDLPEEPERALDTALRSLLSL
jgi:tetracenomycin A2 monooxygenase-dioxygenase